MIFITMNGTYTREELEEVLILADEQEKQTDIVIQNYI